MEHRCREFVLAFFSGEMARAGPGGERFAATAVHIARDSAPNVPLNGVPLFEALGFTNSEAQRALCAEFDAWARTRQTIIAVDSAA
jgi:hypothetical protein